MSSKSDQELCIELNFVLDNLLVIICCKNMLDQVKNNCCIMLDCLHDKVSFFTKVDQSLNCNIREILFSRFSKNITFFEG